MNQRPHYKSHDVPGADAVTESWKTAPLDDLDTEDQLGVDDADIPAYRERPARTAPPPGPSIYELAGRAKPQHIPARKPEPEPEPEAEAQRVQHQEAAGATAAPPSGTALGEATVVDEVAPTPTVGANAPQQDGRRDHRTEALLSDAPTSAYDAPAASPAPVADAQPTAVFPLEESAQAPGDASPQAGDPEPGIGLEADSAAVATATAGTAGAPHTTAVPTRRGTTDLGLLILRVVLGAFLAGEAVARFFMLGGSTGLNGLEEQYAAYANPQVLAIVVPGLQLLAGVFLILGLVTPVGAALAVAATGITVLHGVIGSGGPQDAVLLAIMLLAVSVVVAFTGPGRYGLDYSRGWSLRPLASSWIAVLVGIAGAVAVWFFLGGGF